MKKVLLTAALVLVATSAFAVIGGTKHDFKTGGTSPNKGTSDQTCKFCHVPHAATVNAALWSRTNAFTVGALYTNPGSLDAVTTAPANTQSLGCLGCHQATPSTGVDASTNLTGTIAAAVQIGTALNNDHPIAFVYNAALVAADTATGNGIAGLVAPGATSVGGLPLFNNGSLECATCHAVHKNGTVPMFLRTTNTGSALCLKCHIK